MSDHLIAEANRHAKALTTTHPTHADIAWYVREVSQLTDTLDMLTDTLDMMRDEFQRIVACPGCNAEIEDLANRAQLKLIQHVPVIVQRDRAEAEAMKLRVKNRELRAALTACHSAMLGKVNPKHPAWAVLFAVTEGDK